MESTSGSSADQLADLYFAWRQCEECPLHVHRKHLNKGYGNPDAPVHFVVDRLSPQDLTGRNFPSGGPRQVLELVLGYLEEDLEDYFFSAPAMCPSDPLLPQGPFNKRPELMPLHGKDALAACRPRLHEEIRIVEPEVVVAMGTHALKALYPKNPPSHLPSVGRLLEVPIEGKLTQVPHPLMVTYSPTSLYRIPIESDPEGLWEQTVEHIQTAIDLAKAMRENR